jgi:hypothetical protein
MPGSPEASRHFLVGLHGWIDMVKPSPEEVVKAFRKTAKDLGCDGSEERFRETLFAIGTQKIGDADKPVRQTSRRSQKAARRTES